MLQGELRVGHLHFSADFSICYKDNRHTHSVYVYTLTNTFMQAPTTSDENRPNEWHIELLKRKRNVGSIPQGHTCDWAAGHLSLRLIGLIFRHAKNICNIAIVI